MSGQLQAAMQAQQAQQAGGLGQPGQFSGTTQQYPMANDLVAQIQRQALQRFPASVQQSPYTTPYAINSIPGYNWASMSGSPTSQNGAASQQAIQQAVQQALSQQQQRGQNIPGAPGWNQPNYSMR